MLLILAIFGGFSYVYQINWSHEYKSGESIFKEKKDSQKDTDNDGLLDWEESLRGTDPKNPDTDGDGTNDGEEVKLNRDPLIKGLNDKIENSQKKENDSYKTSESTTDLIAKELFYKYLNLKGEGGLTDAQKQEISGDITEEIKEEKVELIDSKNYSPFEINIAKNGEESVSNYKNNFAKDLSYINNVEGYELAVFARAFKNNSTKDYKKLKNSAEVYSETISRLLSTKTPKSASGYHLSVINSLNDFALVVEEMSNTRDPAEAMIIMNLFIEKEEDLKKSFEEMNTYFSNN